MLESEHLALLWHRAKISEIRVLYRHQTTKRLA
jgi:hypothetical protein